MKLESIDDFLNSFNKISLLIVDRFSAISSGTTRISNTLVNFQFSRCGKIHPKMKSTCKKKNSKYILHQPRVSKILKTNSTFHPPPPFSWKRSKMWKISIKQIVFNPSVKSKILSRHDRNSGLNSIPTRMGGRLVPIQLLPQFESNRIPHRGNLLIARQLDFRVAYGRRGTHRASASPLVKSTTRPRYEINTSRASAWQSRAITLLLRSPPTLQRTNIPLFVRKVFRIPSSKRRFLRDEGRFDVTGGGV